MNSAQDYFNRAAALFDQASYDLAAVAAGQGIDEHPHDGRLWDVFGTAKWMTHEPEQALNALETASVLKTLSPLAQLALGSLYERLGKRELALVIFDHLAGAPYCPTSLLPKLAKRLGHMGEYERALAVCETLTVRNPACHEAYFGIAYYQGKLGLRPAELMEALSMAMDLAPHVLHYRLNLAAVTADAGYPARAYDLLKDIPPHEVCCPNRLRQMIDIFDRFADYDRCWACLNELERRHKS